VYSRFTCAVALAALLCSGACSLDHGASQPIGDVDLILPPGTTLPSASAADAGPPAPEPGRRLGEFTLTYYWMAHENEQAGPQQMLYAEKGCAPIATVTADFARRLEIEGTGQLRDGRVLNTSGPCACPGALCYFAVSKYKRWGVGVGTRALSPFRTVAVDARLVKIGSMLYIPELDGLTMPGREPWGGFVHDGCVLAGDRGAGVDGNQLDFFVGQRVNYNLLNTRHNLRKVTVFDGSLHCQRKGQTVAAARSSI
jgi:3D (Asp-Asp-Asp) domain-containing protein